MSKRGRARSAGAQLTQDRTFHRTASVRKSPHRSVQGEARPTTPALHHCLRPAIIAALAGLVAAGAAAQTPSIYRYVGPDGKIVYSDHMPPANAKDVESKRLIQNYIETDKMSGETQRAQQRFPVTLYTFGCGEVCDRAEALLNKRGVPFTLVNVQESSGAAKLKQLTGELQAPVLQAGDKLISKGFNENLWQALLDDAGYPKTPAPRRGQAQQANVKGSVAPSAVPLPAATPPATAETGGGYPKN